MPTSTELFVTRSVHLLSQDYMPKLTRSLAAMTDADLWWRPNDASNSVGNLLLHLRGNVTQWIIGGVGAREYRRARADEFAARTGPSATMLLHDLDAVVQDACAIISAQSPASLAEVRHIQGYDVTVLDAIYHVVEHFSMHTGQVILLAKARAAIDLGLWQPPATQPGV